MAEDQVEAFCKRTGQMDKLQMQMTGLSNLMRGEQMAPRKEPPKEFPKYQDPVIVEHKKSKFGNIPTEVNGILFDSKKEANYYIELLMRERCGLVRDIKIQPKFILQEAFSKGGKKYQAITYIADFQFEEVVSGAVRIVDTKSKATTTPLFKLKQKLFEKRYLDLTIEIV